MAEKEEERQGRGWAGLIKRWMSYRVFSCSFRDVALRLGHGAHTQGLKQLDD